MASKQRSVLSKTLTQDGPPNTVGNSARDRVANAGVALADRIRGILLRKNLTLYKVSTLTQARYPREPRYHIPRNFYFQLRSAAWSPSLHQLFALSRVSGYRLVDW